MDQAMRLIASYDERRAAAIRHCTSAMRRHCIPPAKGAARPYHAGQEDCSVIPINLRTASFLLLACGIASASYAQGTSSALRRAEERQGMEDTSPRAQYNRSVKEANAAYAEAASECSRMARRQRASCMQDAKSNLKSDLDAARAQAGPAAGARR